MLKAGVSRGEAEIRASGTSTAGLILCVLLQKSTQEWLHPVGDDLSHMIGLKNKRHIKDQLQKIVRNYPDFR